MNSNYYISVIIPLYNERESLLELYEAIINVLERIKKSFEIIFIDDGSTDDSAEVINEMYQKDDRVKLIQFRKNFGKAAALAAGFEHCQGRFIITMDADLQDDPEEIPALISQLEKGYDLVSGWKKQRKDPLTRRLSSRFYNFVTSMISGIRLHDFNCGLKAYRRDLVDSIQIYGELHRYVPFLAHRLGFRITEMEVRHHPRKYGSTKYGASRYTKGFLDLLTVTFLTRYKKRPLHLFGIVGLISFTLGVIILVILAYERIFAHRYLSNRPLLFLGILLIIIGVQFISLGLLGEMVTDINKSHDVYLVKRKLGWPEESKSIFEPLQLPDE